MKLKYAIKRLFLLFTIHYSLFTVNGWAGFFTNSTGVNGGQFLKIPMNAKFVALGENGIAFSGIDFAECNPASIGGQKPVFQFSHLNYFGGLSIDRFQALVRFSSLDYYGQNSMDHFVVFSVKNFTASDEERDVMTGASVGSFSLRNQCLGVGYAAKIKKAYFGVRGKTISEKIAGFSSLGFVLDFGAIVPLGENLKFGGSLLNMGKNFDSGKAPVTLRAGVSAEFPSFLIVSDFEKVCQEKVSFGSGFEYRADFASFRLGAVYGDFFEPSAGVGFGFGNLVFDYAFRWHKYLGANHYFTVSLGF